MALKLVHVTGMVGFSLLCLTNMDKVVDALCVKANKIAAPPEPPKEDDKDKKKAEDKEGDKKGDKKDDKKKGEKENKK